MKKKFPLVSIIVNCYNGEKFLKQSIKSVINQSYKNWEIIFWDNNSTDKSSLIINKFADRRIKYFRSSKFNTLYKSRNLALKKTKGDFICFLDVDDLWKKNKLKDQLRIMKNKRYDVLYSNYFIKNENLKYIKKRNYRNIKCNTQILLDDYSLGILTVMVKRNIFKKKQFNPFYEIIGDFDFFLNLSLKLKFGYISKPLAIYRVHQNNYSFKKIDLYANEFNYWIKNNKKKFKKFSFFKIRILVLKLQIKKILYKLNKLIDFFY